MIFEKIFELKARVISYWTKICGEDSGRNIIVNENRREVGNETKFVPITKKGRGPPLIHSWNSEGGPPIKNLSTKIAHFLKEGVIFLGWALFFHHLMIIFTMFLVKFIQSGNTVGATGPYYSVEQWTVPRTVPLNRELNGLHDRIQWSQ